MAEQDILSQFLKDPSKTDELELYLSSKFGGASQTERSKVVYGGQIEVEYKKLSREIKAVRIVGDISPEYLEDIEKDLDDAVYSDHGFDVGTSYLFTGRPVLGRLRIGNDFQIIPVPDEAPKPDQLMAEHPAILQYSFPKSPHFLVNLHRSGRRASVLMLLLTVFIRGGVFWFSNSGRKTWVLKLPGERAPDEPYEIKTTYQQIGYTTKAEWKERDEFGFFVNENWLDIPRKKHSPYYGDMGFTVGEPFQLPNSFEVSFARYYSLSDKEQAQFLRSAHWLSKSSQVYGNSHSLSYTALVYALEGLAPNPEKSGNCDACGRDLFEKSITERFKEFLDEYGMGCDKEDINEIYSLRSSIAHGGGLMPRDREMTAFRFTAEQNEKDNIYRYLRRACDIVLMNWLYRAGNRLTVAAPGLG